jgi:hypothetical protein
MKPCERRSADTPIRRYVSPSRLRQGVLVLILAIPSLYLLSRLPPLWRDSDGFNEIASTFAPKGIIHWLPAYCLGGRMIVFAGSILGSLLTGHGLPYLSISITPLNDAGVYSLIVCQHVLLVFSLFCAVTVLSDRFSLRVLFAIGFALTPWLYIYAQCVGSEAFSNAFVILIAAAGLNCLRTPDLTKRNILGFFGLLLLAALTRQINALFAALLPVALLPFAVKELFVSPAPAIETGPRPNRPRFRNGRRILIFVLAGLFAIAGSIFVQQTMCWLFQVPYRSTFGQTFEWRLSYLRNLTEQKRSAVLGEVSAKINDPVVSEAFDALNRSLSRGEKWADMFLFFKIDEILSRSGFREMQRRTWQIDLKLNRIATTVLLSREPHFLRAVWTDFKRWPFLSQTDLAHPPFVLTDWLQTQLPIARYGRLRGLASFEHDQGYYETTWQQVSYFHLLDGVPIVVMAGIGIAMSGLGLLIGRCWLQTQIGVAYVISMIIVGTLISLGNCASTFYGARFYLPVFSLFQIAMFLGVSLLVNILMERLETSRNPR